MFEMIVMGLLGTAFLTTFLEASKDDDEPTTDPDESDYVVLPAPEEGDLVGTDANEYHKIMGDGSYAIDMGGGDDLLEAGAGNFIDMGDGDDQLILDLRLGSGELDPIKMGDGDDEVVITQEVGGFYDYYGWARISGGDGADAFKVNLSVGDQGSAYSREGVITSPSGITLIDFDPDEDTLEVEVTWEPGHEQRELVSYEVKNGPNGTAVVFTFAEASEKMHAFTTAIGLNTTRPLTEDDVFVVNPVETA